MCDIIALGFQTDKTRVASLLLARDLSALYYPFLGVSKQHHGASHYDTEEDYQKIVHFQLSQLAYLAQRLDAMPEGESTVLDNSCLLFLSNMWSGTKHDNKKVLVVTIGGLGASWKLAERSTISSRATASASCVACTWASWIGWASNSRSSATPKPD